MLYLFLVVFVLYFFFYFGDNQFVKQSFIKNSYKEFDILIIVYFAVSDILYSEGIIVGCLLKYKFLKIGKNSHQTGKKYQDIIMKEKIIVITIVI